MAHSLTTIGIHPECAIQAEMVVELELSSNRKEAISSISAQIHHKMQESYERCANVKGSVELK